VEVTIPKEKRPRASHRSAASAGRRRTSPPPGRPGADPALRGARPQLSALGGQPVLGMRT